jgi:iron complex outermembrane receptor protein
MTMTTTARLRLLAGTAIAASAAFAVPAFAQEADDNVGLEEIIVTAQKREQSLQDVPIAVSAVTGASLAANRVTTVGDLSALAPGVTVRPSIGGSSIPSFTVRGAVSYGVVPGSDKQVSIYLDGVYLATPRGGLFDLPNVERIEMLRGPQGTLFGRNATAGAVSISTMDPMGEGHVKVSGSIANHDGYRYELTAHTPELGPLSAYFTYVKNKYRGHVRNAAPVTTYDRVTNGLKYQKYVKSAPWLGGKDSDSIFAAVKFESGDFKAVYKFDRNDSSQTPDATGLIGYDFRVGLGGLLGAYVNNIVDAARANGMPLASNAKRPKSVWNSYNDELALFQEGHSLTMSYQVNDQLSIKNIAAFRSSAIESTASLLGVDSLTIPASAAPLYAAFLAVNPSTAALPEATRLAIANGEIGKQYMFLGSGPASRSKQWSNELQVNYDSDFVTVTVGGLWFKGKDNNNEHGQQNTVSFTSLPVGNAIPYLPGIGYNEARSIAGFAQGEFHVTPQLDIVLGARYTNDKKLAQITSLTAATCPTTITQSAALKACPLITGTANYKDNKFNYLVGANFRPNDDILVYAKWSTAYVSGGTSGPFAYKPETAKSAEAGVKADLLNRRLRANLAVFWAEYKDYQTAQGGNTLGTVAEFQALVPDSRVRNALGTFVYPQGDVKAKGFELEVTAAPAEGVVLGGSLSYTKTSFINVPGLLKAAGGLAATAPDSAYIPTLRPEWTANAYAQYTSQPIWDDAVFTARIQGNYQSTMAASPNANIKNTLAAYTKSVPSYWLVNGRMALENISMGAFDATIALWGKNIFDNKSISFPFNQSGGASATYIEPRRYGIDLTVEF